MSEFVRVEYESQIAVITIDNPPVNVLSKGVRFGLQAAVSQLSGDREVAAVVLYCKGDTFIAGADINEFDSGDFEPEINDVLSGLENLPVPVVCAIQGSALGGGFETALSCHYRCATADARVGLPEVNLGLLPGAGGTQRLPRLVGVGSALDAILSGRPLRARQALEIGAIDLIVDEDLRVAALAYAQQLVAAKAPPRRTSEMIITDVEQSNKLLDEYRQHAAKKYRGLVAPAYIIDSVEAAVKLPFERGLSRERELFIKCMNSSQSAALRHLFFAERDTTKIPHLERGVAPRQIATTAVIGAGTMGTGIAMSLANAGLPVTLIEVNEAALEAGLNRVRDSYQASLAQGRISENVCDQRVALIEGACNYDAIADVDLIIEAVFEDMAIKKEVFRKLDGACKQGAILATNTSTLNVDEIAGVTGRAGDVLGLHFFSPANIMKLLEVVRGMATRDEVLITALALAKKLRKTPVVSGVCYGFIGNRMLEGYIREAGFLLLEGASPQQVDQALVEFGMAMGPFAMGDMAGLDLNAKVLKERRARGELPEDERYGLVIAKLVEIGRFGQKTGKGFYRYAEGSRVPQPDPEVDRIIDEQSVRLNMERRTISNDEIVRRCIYPLILEAVKILDEGIAYRTGDIDVVWVYGYGFPAYKGGPLHYADHVGVSEIYKSVIEFRESLPGSYWEPADSLIELAERNGSFSDLQGGA